MRSKLVRFLIVLGSHLAHIISIGMCISFGILYSEIRAEFKASHSETAWIVSIYNGLIGLVGVPLGLLVHKISERWLTVVGTLLLSAGMITSSLASRISTLYITYGLISGFGAGIVHYCANTIIVRHFNAKWRPLAITLGNSGSAVCSLVLPPMITFCVNMYSWKTTFVVLGGLSALGLFSAATFVPSQEETQCDTGGASSSTVSKDGVDLKTAADIKQCVVSILKNSNFMIFFVSNVTAFVVVFAPATFLPDLMLEARHNQQDISICVMAMGFGNLAGRLLSGMVASKFNRRVQLIHALTLSGFAVTTAAMALSKSLASFVVLSTFLGMFSGGYFGLHVAVVAHYLDRSQLSVGFGMIITANGVALTGGVPLAGLMSDKFRGEKGSFVFGGCVLFIATLVLIINAVKKLFRRKTMDEEFNVNNNSDFNFENEMTFTYL